MPASAKPRSETGTLNLLDEKRSAHASIRGYLYQTCLGVLRWLDLQENEILLCEGDEDLDRFLLSGGAVSEQVKAYTGGLSITDRVVRDSLRNFLRSYVALRQRGEDRNFVFTTTAYEKKRRDGLDLDLLKAWREGKRTLKVIKGVRSLVQPSKKDPNRKAIEEARTWLDKKSEGWKGFMDAVEWSFDAPDLEALRDQIERKLQAERSALSSVVLLDRLIVAVLQASSQKEVEKRVLTKADIDAQVGAFLADLGKAASAEAVRIRSVFEEVDNLRDLLDEGTRELPKNPTPGQMLTAAFEVIPFQETGRREELASLATWCESDIRRSVLLLTGEGGCGKSRLMLEWCRRLRHQGWHAGFLKRNRQSNQILPLVKGNGPRLVVIDYAETRLGIVEPLLIEMGQAPPSEGPKLRVVLLARREADWWTNLSLLSGDVAELLARSGHRSLEALASKDLSERQQAFQIAVEGFSEVMNREIPKTLKAPDLSRPRFDQALYLHMAALSAVQGENIETAEDALEQTLAHERRFWRSKIEDQKVDRPQEKLLVKGLETAVAAVTLVAGTASLAQTQALLKRTLELLPLQPHHTDTILNLLRDLYQGASGGNRHYLDPLQPDLLGEQWIAEALGQDNSLLGRVLDGASSEEGYQTLTVLTRLAQRRPDLQRWIGVALHGRLEQLTEIALNVAVETGDPLGLVLAREVEAGGSLKVMHLVQRFCDDERYQRSVPLREVACLTTERTFELLRGQRQDLDENQQAELARLANNLGYRRSALGLREGALSAAHEAVNIYRQLARRHPDTFLLYLANGLNNLGNRLSDLGLRDEALGASKEAVDTYQQLGQQETSSSSDFAKSLDNLGLRLGDLGCYEDALNATNKAVEIYRQLAHQQPGVFLSDFGRCLGNLSLILSNLGHGEDALSAANEAVEIYRQLARQRSDVFLPDLGVTLNNLANLLGHLGRHEDALDASNAAVEIYRQFASQRPNAFLPGLARSLQNLGNNLSALRRPEDAFVATNEAVEIYRQLARQRPNAFLPDLAAGLYDLCIIISNLGRREDSLDAASEAVEIYRQLARQWPDAFLPNLAASLNNLAVKLRDLSHCEDAFKAAEEAIRVLAPFFLRLPAAFAPHMSAIVGNYLDRAEAAHKEPDKAFLTPIFEAFQSLRPSQGPEA